METTSNLVQKTLTLKKAYAGPRCSVMNCDNSSRKRDELGLDISFHRFPRDPLLQKEWIRRCRPLVGSRGDANISNRQVCSAHFDPRFFCKKHKPSSKTKLVDGTLPTLNLPPQPEEEVVESYETDPLGFPLADKPQQVESSSGQQPVDCCDMIQKRFPNEDLSPAVIETLTCSLSPSTLHQYQSTYRQRASYCQEPDADRSYEQDIEMVELSSEDEEEIDVIVSRLTEESSPALTTAAALAATSALHVPRGRPPNHPPKMPGRRGRRKSSATERSPTKSIILVDASMDGSMDSSRYSDDDLEDEEIILIPSEELEYIDLQDPLEMAYKTWRSMNEKSRRATIRAYLSRLASFLPPRYPRNNKPSIMESSIRYLDDVTKENAILAVEQEILMQRHYILRKKRTKLDKLIKKKRMQK